MQKQVDQMSEIHELLRAAQRVIEDVKAKQTEGAGFNVFRLCGVDHYETMHSKILAEFLSPQGSHGQGDFFLKRFCMLLKRLCDFKGEFSAAATVATEYSGYIRSDSIGRFDILIEDDTTKSVCIIENKIFAGEQPKQLERYAKWLEERRKKDWNAILVFLTLNGKKAWSIKEGVPYQRLAYVNKQKSDVPCFTDWINTCCKELPGVSPVKYALEQYKNHIGNLATGEAIMTNEIVEMLKQGNMKSARLISDAFYTAKEEIEISFFREIGETLKSTGWKLDINDENDVWNGLDAKSGEGERGWSWRFHVEQIRGRSQLWCRVFIKELCQVGIRRNDFMIEKTQAEFGKWCEKNKKRLRDANWVVGEWEYPLYRDVLDDELHPIEWNEDFYDRLVTDEHYRDIVKNNIIKGIEMLRGELSKFIGASSHSR